MSRNRMLCATRTMRVDILRVWLSRSKQRTPAEFYGRAWKGSVKSSIRALEARARELHGPAYVSVLVQAFIPHLRYR